MVRPVTLRLLLAGWRAARAESGAAGEDLAAARADLVFEITRAFWALVTAGETERVLERSLAAGRPRAVPEAAAVPSLTGTMPRSAERSRARSKTSSSSGRDSAKAQLACLSVWWGLRAFMGRARFCRRWRHSVLGCGTPVYGDMGVCSGSSQKAGADWTGTERSRRP